ncbi:hypothetical protein mRhiFer1_009703 [Rhinolophus ferrumequinum]|uniref:Uncharacterized protein n=1 Tax=Rhinolophus ferrumequinum TaxID=59479 RepID=A0A7J7QZK5_RHIFE|nr:hypothetical protein mRhiFer1_009703 [Rhinolophus ferrumequinum]
MAFEFRLGAEVMMVTFVSICYYLSGKLCPLALPVSLDPLYLRGVGAPSQCLSPPPLGQGGSHPTAFAASRRPLPLAAENRTSPLNHLSHNRAETGCRDIPKSRTVHQPVSQSPKDTEYSQMWEMMSYGTNHTV